jgi:hypothetical protein
MLCNFHRPHHDDAVQYNSNSTIIFFSIGNNDTVPIENIDDDTVVNNRRDTILVILAFLSIIGCFIYSLCKCSNSWYVIILLFGIFWLIIYSGSANNLSCGCLFLTMYCIVMFVVITKKHCPCIFPIFDFHLCE